MIIELSNNLFVIDGISLWNRIVYLERVMFINGEIEYTEDYREIGLFQFFNLLSREIAQFIQKENLNERNWGKNWNATKK